MQALDRGILGASSANPASLSGMCPHQSLGVPKERSRAVKAYGERAIPCDMLFFRRKGGPMGNEASRFSVSSRSSAAPAAGDVPLTEAAFTDALLRYQWPLFAFLRGFVLNDEQAHDLTQDVFCDAWRARQRLAAPFVTSRQTPQPDVEGIRRWLFHTAYHRAISTWRRARLIRWESLDAHVAHAADHASGAATMAASGVMTGSVTSAQATQASGFVEPFIASFEDQVIEGQTLRAALATLSPPDVATLLLSIVHGFTTVEIAQVIGATPDAAKKRLSRAKRRLRDSYLAQNAQQDTSTHTNSDSIGDISGVGKQLTTGEPFTSADQTGKERRA